MNGFKNARPRPRAWIRGAVLAAGLAGGLAGSGCEHYRNVVDPCWPERWNYMARYETRAAFVPQVRNGRVLEQTVWNYHFECGTDKLNPDGLTHLAYLARRRPSPEETIYLQTAQVGTDLPYDQCHPEKLVQARRELDARREVAIKAFLEAQTADRPTHFQVVVHDPHDPSIAAYPASLSVISMHLGARGVLATGATTVTGGGGTSTGGIGTGGGGGR